MDDSIDRVLLARYILEECTPEERARVESWIRVRTDREALVTKLLESWQSIEREAAPQSALDSAWQRLDTRIRLSEKKTSVPKDRLRQARRPRERRHTWSRTIAVLAMIFLAISIGRSMLVPATEIPIEPALKVVKTQRGQRANVRLTDGSEIHLNVDGRLAYPAMFSSHERKVYLEGEAFFNVVPDSGRPFIIQTPDAEVRVLGTSFNVRNYPGENRATVAVASGHVALRVALRATPVPLVLDEHDVGIIAEGVMRPVIKEVDLNHYFAWVDTRLVFVDAPFEEVVRRLERWYDLEIRVNVPLQAVSELDASFSEEPLNEILNVVAATLDLKYAREDRQVVFYR